MKIQSVCINCGAIKRRIGEKCKNCKFTPKTMDDKAKSIILSARQRYGNRAYGSKQEALREAAEAIKSKQEVAYNSNEIGEAKKFLEKASSITWATLIFGLFRMFWPVIALFVVVSLLLVVVK